MQSSTESDPLAARENMQGDGCSKAKIRQDPAEQQPSSVLCGMMVTITPSVEAKPCAGSVGWCDRRPEWSYMEELPATSWPTSWLCSLGLSFADVADRAKTAANFLI